MSQQPTNYEKHNPLALKAGAATNSCIISDNINQSMNQWMDEWNGGMEWM